MATRKKKIQEEQTREAPQITTAAVLPWLRGQLLQSCARVDLRRYEDDGRTTFVRRWHLMGQESELGEDGEPMAAEALAYQIVLYAQDEADTFEDTQRYQLEAVNDEGGVMGRRSFKVQGRATERAAGDDDEPVRGRRGGKEEGTAGQVAAILDTVLAFKTRSEQNENGRMADILAHYQLALRASQKELDDRRARDLEEIQMRESLASELHERQMMMRREAFNEELKGKAFKTFAEFLPVIGMRFLSAGPTDAAGKPKKGETVFGEAVIRKTLTEIFADPAKTQGIALLLGAVEFAKLGELHKAFKRDELPPAVLVEDIFKSIVATFISSDEKMGKAYQILGTETSTALFGLFQQYVNRDAAAEGAGKGTVEVVTKNGKAS